MAILALAVIVAAFGTMACVFSLQARAERRRLGALARAALDADGVFDTVVAQIDRELPGPPDPVEVARVLRAA